MSVISGPKASKAQNKASKRDQENAREANAQNYKLFQQGRGSRGSALFPIYAKKFEKEYYGEVADGFRESGRDIVEYRDATARFRPMADKANAAAEGIFDGSTTEKRLANLAPVKDARVSYRRQASVDAMNKILNDIEADRARGGFTGGDSSANQNLRFRAAKGAGDDLAATNVQNVEEERSIRDAGLDLELANLGLPAQLAAANLSLLTAPDNAYTDALSRRIAMTNGLRIAPGHFQVQPLPMEQPNIGVLGAFAQGASQVGATVYDHYAKQRQAEMYRDAYRPRYSGYDDQIYKSVTTPTGGYSAPTGFYTPAAGAVAGSSMSNWGSSAAAIDSGIEAAKVLEYIV